MNDRDPDEWPWLAQQLDPGEPALNNMARQFAADMLHLHAGKVAQEIVQHPVGLVGADVRVTLEIEADMPDGAPDHVVRTVTENARTMGFKTQGFEES